MHFVIRTLLTIAILAVGASIIVSPVHAADPKHTISNPAYAARLIKQSIPDPVQMEAGSVKTVVFTFKNTGTATWNADAKNYLSAYTVEPRYRDSLFAGSNWLASRQTAKLAGVVKPGATTDLAVELKAPETPGEYSEEFYLAAENTTWIKGGYFYVKISVTPKKSATPATSESSTASAEAAVARPASMNGYQAKRMFVNKKQLDAKGGEIVPIILGIQNSGTESWSGYTLTATPITADNKAGLSRTLSQKTETLNSEEITREEISLAVPERRGIYLVRFAITTGGNNLPLEVGTITVNVTEDAAIITEPEYTLPVEPLTRMAEEPRIRVGIWKDPARGVEFVSDDETYIVYDGETRMGSISPGIRVSMWQTNGVYSFQGGGVNFTTTNYIRLAPETNQHAVFRIPNYERLISYRGKLSFNSYRGAMEYRTTKSGEGIYVINDLLFEDYVAGIAETSNEAHMEYIKALLTAARTYAYYIQNHTTKHDTRFFDVLATTADQLYLGYESEKLMPRVAEAARLTRGVMVTYDTDSNSDTPAEIVITPYFANADSRTRSWIEVWGGAEKPWLVSVGTVYDARDKKALYGHGVGMSGRDASLRAGEKGENFEQLLQYYYTGVGLERMYK